MIFMLIVGGRNINLVISCTGKNCDKHSSLWKVGCWKINQNNGSVLQPALLWARVPKLFAAVAMLYGVLDRGRSPITPVLRSLITVRVSQINWCNFCVDINSYMFSKRTGSLEKLDALEKWQESSLFDEKEKAVLEYTDAITLSDTQVTSLMVERLREYFDDDGIVELTGLIAFQNLSSKFNSALDVPAQGFCRLPTQGNEEV